MPEEFANLSKGMNLQMKEVERTLYRMNLVKSIVGYSIIKFLKIKTRKKDLKSSESEIIHCVQEKQLQ